MKLPCEIIDDLLPLYEDGVCNLTTKEAVREHLESCPRCRSRQTADLLPEAEPADELAEAAAVKKSFQKVKRVWIISLAAVLAVTLLLGGLYQMYTYAFLPRDYSQCLAQGEAFIRHLRDGEFEEAIEMVPLPYQSEQWLAYHRQEFVDAMEDCWDQGIRIESYEGFGGYDLAATQHHDPSSAAYFNEEYHYYRFNVRIRLSSGEVVDGELAMAFKNGKPYRLQLTSHFLEDVATFETALSHTELIHNLLYGHD